ncbi:MAG: M3 family oligoendopeptidase [Treponema sp.]|uniref:M3 family oligoendopeptidase n=1 Tax=Treponema sp. TaxID=166 RepID=UPI00298D96C9|nr:M3 family oligoendopeptidase [Treponema sp.]MBR5933358.1 M3 family oligoendopeptidase [Treponema sp.]
MSNLPKWNLDSIYPDINSSAFTDAVKNFEEQIEQLLKINLNDGDALQSIADFFKVDETTAPLANTLAAYSYSVYSTDTTNKDYLDNLNKIESLITEYENQLNTFSKKLSDSSSYLEEFYKKFPQYKKYEFYINEILADHKHRLSPAEEKLASTLQQTGGKAWDRLHEQLISNLRDEQTQKLFNELRNDAYSPDAELRKTSWQKETAILKQNEIAFAACLNNLKGETTSLLNERKWNSAIDRALFSSRMKKETLDALIGAIEESLPDWRRYLKSKAEYLKKHNATVSTPCGINSGIAFYDMYAPLPDCDATASKTGNARSADGTNCNASSSQTNNVPSKNTSAPSLFTKSWTFDEARDYIIKEYNSFSPRMGDFARMAFEKNWIDAPIYPGKVGGAYCQDFYVQKESRVLTNFTGAFSDIITLAHELGHAFHFNCIKDRDYKNAVYPMTLAETASTFAETIVKQDILKTACEQDKIKLLELDLQDTCAVLVDILSRFYFERSVFEERKSGELGSEDFCRLMRDAQQKSYGDGLNDERHEYMWAVKSHYYSVDLDFYNFPYAFGQLFSAGLYSRFKKEGSAFASVYCDLLADTGSMTCEDLCLKAGFDITTKEFWKTGIDMYVKEIDEFCKLCEG